MAYRIWATINDRRFVIGWTESKRDAMATVRTIPDSTFEDTANDDD